MVGSYRKVVVKPDVFECRVFKYHKDTLEELETGEMTGVEVKISLPSSSYATVCLREIIGSDSNLEVEEDMSIN